MLWNLNSKFTTAAAVFFLIIAAAISFCSALPLEKVIDAAGAALFLFTFSEINRILSPARSHLLVSGELSAAATAVIAAGVFAAGAHPAFPAAVFLLLCAFGLFKENDTSEMLLTGILALIIFAVAASFLMLKKSLTADALASIATGSHFQVHPVISASIAASAAVLALFFSPRLAGSLSSVSSEIAPAGAQLLSITLTLLRAVSIFAAFVMSGAMIFPIEPGDDRLRSSCTLLMLYLSIALITSSAALRGWSFPVLAVLFSASYVRYYFALRRSRHARYQRSFIRCQRNTNT